MTTKSVDLTEPQRVLLTTLTDQRVANLINLADVIGDMNVDGLEFLRRLGDPRFAALTNFLSHAKPETLVFLTEARPEEVANLEEGIRLVVALQLLGRVGNERGICKSILALKGDPKAAIARRILVCGWRSSAAKLSSGHRAACS